MRIAFFVNEFPVVSETFIANQIIALKSKGYDIDIYPFRRGELGVSSGIDSLISDCNYCWDKPSSRLGRVLKGTIVVGAIVLRSPRLFLYLVSLIVKRDYREVSRAMYGVTPLLYSRATPDLALAHFGPQGVRVALAKRFKLIDCPFAVFFHGYDVNEVPRMRGNGVYADLFDAADLLLASSIYMINRLREIGAPGCKIRRIPLGVRLEEFPFKDRTPQGNRVCIISVARLVEFKGIEFGIRALAKLKCDNTKYIYRIIGDGPLLCSLKELAQRLDVADNVEFLGSLPAKEVAYYLDRSNLFLAPGIEASNGLVETQGVALLEAQACGLPVVASDVGGVSESVVHGVGGYLVAEKNVAELVEVIRCFELSKHKWKDLGRQGRKYVSDNYCQSIEIENLEKCLWEINFAAKKIV